MTRPLLASIEEIRGLKKTASSVVSESWIDMFGHMNVMWYTHLFSEAMAGVADQLGLSHDYLAANDLGTFALKLHANYVAELRVDTKIGLYTRFLGRSERMMHAMHYLVNEEGNVVAATGETLNAFIDMKTRRMTEIPSEVAERLDGLIEADAKLDWATIGCGGMAP